MQLKPQVSNRPRASNSGEQQEGLCTDYNPGYNPITPGIYRYGITHDKWANWSGNHMHVQMFLLTWCLGYFIGISSNRAYIEWTTTRISQTSVSDWIRSQIMLDLTGLLVKPPQLVDGGLTGVFVQGQPAWQDLLWSCFCLHICLDHSLQLRVVHLPLCPVNVAPGKWSFITDTGWSSPAGTGSSPDPRDTTAAECCQTHCVFIYRPCCGMQRSRTPGRSGPDLTHWIHRVRVPGIDQIQQSPCDRSATRHGTQTRLQQRQKETKRRRGSRKRRRQSPSTPSC